MGYRSDVGLALTKMAIETLHSKLAEEKVSEELRTSVKRLLTHADEHYTDTASGAEVWYWDGSNGTTVIMLDIRISASSWRFLRN